LDVSQTSFDLCDNLDEVVDIETAAGRASNNGHPARAQRQRFKNLPGHTHLLLWLCRKRYANRVADTFMKQDPETNGRLDCSGERRASLGHTEMEWIIDLLSEQTISCDSAMHV